MEISYLIVTHNTKEMLRSCIASIYEKTGAVTFEIIVIDNGSQDDTVAAISKEFPVVRFIRNEESIGFGGGNNQGLAIAQGEYLFITEPDTMLRSSAGPERMTAYMRSHPDIGILGPKLLLMKSGGVVQRSAFVRFPSLLTFFSEWTPLNECAKALRINHPGKYYYDTSELKEPTDVAWVLGGIILARRSVMKEVGGFDRNIFLLAEDTDLCRRVRSQGYRIVYYPNVEVDHLWGANQLDLAFTVGCYFDGMTYYLRKHHSNKYVMAFCVLTYLCSLFSVPLYALGALIIVNKRTSCHARVQWYAQYIRCIHARMMQFIKK